MRRILILDGDSIAYKCSAAGEERFIKVTHKPSSKSKVFKHRTAFKESMQEKGKDITEDYLIEDCQEPEPISFVLSTINNHIARIADEVLPDEIKIFAGETNNFRVQLPLPKKYKGQRAGSIRPVHLKEAKEFLQKKYGAKAADGCEVDDLCSIAAYDALKEGDEAVMYFYEKDQYQLDGVTLLYDEDSFRFQKVPELGDLRLEKNNTVKGLGLKFLAYQWICSDPVDNYCAYDLSKVKFGAKSAYKVLVDCNTEQEVLEKVKQQFKTFYPEPFEYEDWQGLKQQSDWLGMLRLYYKACRMMRSKDDKLQADDLFKEYGVDLE